MFGWVLNASVFLTVDEIYESQEAHSEPSQLSLMELLREWLTAFSRETFLQKVLYQIFYRVLNLPLASEHISFKSNTNYHLVWEITRENTISYMRKHQTAYEL